MHCACWAVSTVVSALPVAAEESAGSAISFQSLPRQPKGIISSSRCAVRRGLEPHKRTHPSLQRWRLDLVLRIHAHSFLRTPPTAFIPLLSVVYVQRPPSRLSPCLNSSTYTCSFRQRDINPIRGFHLVRRKCRVRLIVGAQARRAISCHNMFQFQLYRSLPCHWALQFWQCSGLCGLCRAATAALALQCSASACRACHVNCQCTFNPDCTVSSPSHTHSLSRIIIFW